VTGRIAGALAVAIALTLTACGGSAEPGEMTPSDDAAFPRTVEHAMGQTEIPRQPERVVVLDTGELDTALSLGVTPVGAVTTAVSDGSSAISPRTPRTWRWWARSPSRTWRPSRRSGRT
jgi:ABC-type Fe3+-hydroxamate transport system substrate-binding protein